MKQNKKFDVVLLDPPWPSLAGRGHIDKPGGERERFPKVDIQRIIDMPFGHLLEQSCHMYIWVMNIKETEDAALEMFKKHGFQLKSKIVWVKTTKSGKPNMAFGGFYRHCYETMFMGVRGKKPAGVKNLPNVILAPRQRIAEKPDLSYDYINAMSTGEKLEIFARRKMDGWSVWGNEVECEVDIDF